MTITIPDRSTDTRHGTLDMTVFEAAWEDESPCEADHRVTVCSGEVVWSMPPYPCGCRPRINVCQSVHDNVFDSYWVKLFCPVCDFTAPASEWRRGWYRV